MTTALGCPSAPQVVVYDLARRLALADRWSSRDVLMFGTPAADPHQTEGFYSEPPRVGGGGFVWSQREAELAFTWPEVEARAAVVDLAPFRGVRGQSVEVRLNGASVGRFALNDERHRYRLALPAAAQKRGDNRLRFLFAATASPADQPGNPDRRQLAAAFYELVVAGESDPGLDDLLAREAPPVFGLTETAGVPTVVQLGPSVLRFALRLPAAAELRFVPDLHPGGRAGGGAVSLRVTVEARPGEESELWSRVITARDDRAARREVRVPLPGREGDIVRLALYVAPAASPRFAWATWTAPRVLGRDASDPLDPPGPAGVVRAEGGAGSALGRSLGGLNVMLIVLDAARAREFGCYGYGRATTPEIDRIAGEAVLFEQAITPAVYTLAAMSSVWTSQYPDRHRVISYTDRLPPDRLTLPELLAARGVRTAGFVANAMAGRAFGFERGFSEFHEVFNLFPEELGSRAGSFRRVLPAWLSSVKDRRFFAYLHVREPHHPYDPPPPFDTRFGPNAPLTLEQRRDRAWYTAVNQGKRTASAAEIEHLVRLYDGNLAYADQEVGAVRQALEAAGLWDRTLLIITADHGEQLAEHGYISHSAQVYEESMHIPLIVRFPDGRGPRGRRIDRLVDLLDLAPTVAEVFGLGEDPAVRREFQGVSLFSVVEGAPGKGAVLARTVWEHRPVYGLRDQRYKLVYDARTGREQLFDVRSDPGERRERQAEDVLRAAYYRQALQHWVARLAESRGQASAAAPAAPTAEECENLRSLGYVVAACGSGTIDRK